MNKFQIYTVFGVMFLSSILLGNGIYSTNISLFALENQTGTENEAEIEADIEQENKCKKDSDCDNENEINNSLNIVNNGTQPQQKQVISPCEDCFTSILTEEQISSFLEAFTQAASEGQFATLEDLCDFITEFQGFPELNEALSEAAFGLGVVNPHPLTGDQYQALIQCLQDAGFNVDFPPS